MTFFQVVGRVSLWCLSNWSSSELVSGSTYLWARGGKRNVISAREGTQENTISRQWNFQRCFQLCFSCFSQNCGLFAQETTASVLATFVSVRFPFDFHQSKRNYYKTYILRYYKLIGMHLKLLMSALQIHVSYTPFSRLNPFG